MRDKRVRSKRIGAGVRAALLVVLTTALVGGGVSQVLGSSANDAQASSPPSGPAAAPGAAPLRSGNVVADDSVGDLATEVALGRTRTQDGAVTAFVAYAAWLLGSPAAAADPEGAVRAVGGAMVNPADAHLLAGMQRGHGDGLAAASGAYRVLGFAGDAKAPTEVMAEVVAPLKLAGSTRWTRIGGVVTWTSSGWRLTSIQPGEVPQPGSARSNVHSFMLKERSQTLAGLGWQAFARSTGR